MLKFSILISVHGNKGKYLARMLSSIATLVNKQQEVINFLISLLSLQEQHLNSLQKLDGKIINIQLITRKYFRDKVVKSGLFSYIICTFIVEKQMQELKDVINNLKFFP